MKSATELYHVRLSRSSFALGGMEFPLKNGLLATVEGLAGTHRNDKKLLRAVATAMGAKTSDVDKIKRILEDRAQVEWYRAKGSEPPPAILERVERNAAAAAAGEAPPPEPTAKPKVSRADGPTGLARTLIAQRVDSDEIMRQVKAKFGKGAKIQLKFERGDLNRLRRRIEEQGG